MGCKTIVEQLSEALGKENVNNSDTFPLVENNTLYRVTIGNLATSLGLTGAITGLNGGSASPVLTGTAPNYQIRGIVGGKGAAASVNGNGSITIDTQLNNAGNSSNGEPLIPNVAASTILMRRLKAGRGISLTTESNSIIIDNDEVAASNKTVIVSELSDLPTPVSGVITLADDTIYFFVNDVSTSNRFVMGQNTVLTSNDPFVVGLTYTGTGDMFTLVNGLQGFKDISLSCPNGTLLDSSAVTTGALLMRWIYIPQVKNFGTLKHPSVGLYDWFIVSHTGQGLVYGAATNARFRSTNFVFQSTTDATGIMLDLNGATFDEFNLEAWQFLSTVTGQKFLKGSAAAGNLSLNTIGFVSKVVIQGDMTGLDTITEDDAGWDFTDNNTISDTEPRAQTYLTSPTNTVVSVASTDYVVTGPFTESIASIFTTNVNGRITYDGRRDKYVRMDCTMSFEPTAGTNKLLTVAFKVNGVTQAETKVIRNCSAGSPAVVSVDWGFKLSKNDFVEVCVSNTTDTTDIKVNQLLIRAS